LFEVNCGLWILCLASGFLFLALKERVERYSVAGIDLEPDSRDVAHALALGASDTFDPHFVVFVDEVEGAVAGQECGDDFAVLYELDSHTLAHGTVWLAAFDTHLLKNYPSALRSSLKWVRLVVEAEHAALVGWIVPSEAFARSLQFAGAK